MSRSNAHDRLGLSANASFVKMLSKKGTEDEVVLLSLKVNKVNRHQKVQIRAVAITNRAIYNLNPSELSKCKRRIAFDDITEIIIASKSDDAIFVVPSDHNYHIKSDFRDEIVNCVVDAVHHSFSRDLPVSKVATMSAKSILDSPSTSRSISESSTTASGDFEFVKDTMQVGNHERLSFEHFDLVKPLGKGAFGKVLLVAKKDTKKLYAMKILKKSFIVENHHVEHTMVERAILAAFDNPFIMSLRFAFQTETKLYLVMDYYQGGELLRHLERVQRFSEDQARFIIGEIIVAIGHLHSLHFIYRDLKPENILMDDAGHVCLTDFGLSKKLDPDTPFATTFVGTPTYIPPEIIDQKPHGKEVDWWSLGVLLFELVVGIPPFIGENMNEVFDKILNDHVVFPEFPTLSDPLQDLISNLLNKDPSARLGHSKEDFEEIMTHPWFDPIDWEKMMKKELSPLYKPPAKNTPIPEEKATLEDAVASSMFDSNKDLLSVKFENFTYTDRSSNPLNS